MPSRMFAFMKQKVFILYIHSLIWDIIVNTAVLSDSNLIPVNKVVVTLKANPNTVKIHRQPMKSQSRLK